MKDDPCDLNTYKEWSGHETSSSTLAGVAVWPLQPAVAHAPCTRHSRQHDQMTALTGTRLSLGTTAHTSTRNSHTRCQSPSISIALRRADRPASLAHLVYARAVVAAVGYLLPITTPISPTSSMRAPHVSVPVGSCHHPS